MNTNVEQTQNEILEWSTRNFGRPVNLLYNIEPLLLMIYKVGMLSHHVLKASQGIRGTVEEHEEKFKAIVESIESIDLDNLYLFLQDKAARSSQVDFDCSSFLGMMEEMGELAKAILDANTEEQEDALADIFVYFLDLHGRNNKNAVQLLDKVWNKVKQRDWNKNKKDGTTHGTLAGGSGKPMQQV